MKRKMFFIFGLLLFSMGAMAEEPIQIVCGSLEEGSSVKFAISPGRKVVFYETYQDGKLTTSNTYGGFFAGYYGNSSLSFSSSGYHGGLTIHGSYTEVLRVNKYSAITIGLSKPYGADQYKLSAFSEGSLITTSFGLERPLPETSYTAFLGLSCATQGLF